jgi:hypothetical protein
MSFATTSPHRSDPAATTTTTNTTTTTVTTTVTGPQTTSAAPTISSRELVGWHARQLKFSWDKPTDQHKYRNIMTGRLPLKLYARMTLGYPGYRMHPNARQKRITLTSPQRLGRQHYPVLIRRSKKAPSYKWPLIG